MSKKSSITALILLLGLFLRVCVGQFGAGVGVHSGVGVGIGGGFGHGGGGPYGHPAGPPGLGFDAVSTAYGANMRPGWGGSHGVAWGQGHGYGHYGNYPGSYHGPYSRWGSPFGFGGGFPFPRPGPPRKIMIIL